MSFEDRFNCIINLLSGGIFNYSCHLLRRYDLALTREAYGDQRLPHYIERFLN